MERYHEQMLSKVINLESRIFFLEQYLNIEDKSSETGLKRDDKKKPVKIIIEKEPYKMIFHPEEINSLSLVRYLEDSFYDVFLFRIYLHGSNAVHEENVVKTH